MRITTLLAALALAAAATLNAGAQTASAGPYYAAPSWDQQLPASSRFIVLTNWGSQAFLDREDGLVWEVNIHPTALFGNALSGCQQSNTGGRAGWRIPTLRELSRTFLVANPVNGNSYPFSLAPGLPVPFAAGQVNIWSTTQVTDANGFYNPASPNRQILSVNSFFGIQNVSITGFVGGGNGESFQFLCVQSPGSSPLE